MFFLSDSVNSLSRASMLYGTILKAYRQMESTFVWQSLEIQLRWDLYGVFII